MKKKLFLILFITFTFLISNNVYAAECKYNEGGIACCKKYGKVRVSEGTTVEAICTNKGSATAIDWSTCYKDNTNVTRYTFDSKKVNASTKNGCNSITTAYFGHGNYKATDCSWKNNGCYCKVYEKKASEQVCYNWECPKGSKYVSGSTYARGQKPLCSATETTMVNGCIEYEEKEAERVCPPYISWANEDTNAEFKGCQSKLASYSDSYDWNSCVYTDETMKEDLYGDSAYCPVYCLENFSADVSNYTPSVKAGTNFVFPSSNNYLEGSRWCTTKYINYDKFLSDLEYANQMIRSYYIDWKREELKQKIIDEFSPSSSKDCANYCDYNVGKECCKVYGKVLTTCDDKDEDGNVIGEHQCFKDRCITTDNPYNHGYTWSWKNTGSGHSELLYVDGIVSARPSVSIWCSIKNGSSVEPPTAEVEKYKKLYEQWLSRAKAIYNRMKNCYDWGDFTQEDVKKEFYNVDPKVSITYKGANGNTYTYEDALNVSTNIEITKNIEECVNTTVEIITGYDSNNNKIVKKYPIKKCSNREVQANSYSTLSLKDDVYRYVNKANGQSFHTNQLKSFGNSKYFNYIDIGYGNLPVGFATKPGVYGYSTGIGELSLTYSHIGHIDKNGNSKIEKVIEAEATKTGNSDYNKIYCDYKVTNGLVPNKPSDSEDTTGGITLIYRPIDLYNPFPNIDGKGRNTGVNWCDSKNCSNTNEIVKKYILNNRGVVGDEVYNLEPMYSFTLTPSDIMRIREYNKTNSYDYDSTGMKTGMVCDKGKGTRCISDYLTELIEMTNATGTCTQNRKDSFDTCRY